jgi:hypothetical protein
MIAPQPDFQSSGQRKTGASLLLTPVIRNLGSSHSASVEAEVGSIRR